MSTFKNWSMFSDRANSRVMTVFQHMLVQMLRKWHHWIKLAVSLWVNKTYQHYSSTFYCKWGPVSDVSTVRHAVHAAACSLSRPFWCAQWRCSSSLCVEDYRRGYVTATGTHSKRCCFRFLPYTHVSKRSEEFLGIWCRIVTRAAVTKWYISESPGGEQAIIRSVIRKQSRLS